MPRDHATPDRTASQLGSFARDEHMARDGVTGVLPPFIEEAVEDAEAWQRLSAVFEQMPAGVVIVEAPTGRILSHNRRAAELFGGTMPSADSLEDYALNFTAVRIDGSHYSADEFPVSRSIRFGETVVDEEIEFRLPEGEARVLRVSASPVRTRDGEIRFAVATLTDVTEQRSEGRRREFFSRLANAFRARPEPREIIGTAATALGEQLGVSSAALAELHDHSPALHLLAEYRNGVICVTETRDRLEFGAEVLAQLRAGRVVAVEDVARHPLIDDDAVEAFTAIEARSVLAVPVRRAGVADWVVLVTHVAPRRWLRGEVTLATQLAERTWTAYEEALRASTLEKSEEWLRLALRAGAAAAWEWDLATDRLTWSEEHHTVLGTNPDAMIATTEAFLACVHDEDRERAGRAIARIARMELEREVGMECRIVRQEGETRWVRVQGRVLLGESGRPLRAYGVVLDVTERKQAELEREELLGQLREANEAKSNFISVMSHEFRTPLTSVIGYAELLESGATGELTDRQKQQMGRIKASAWHLTQVIDEVLVFSRMEAGRIEVRLAPVDAAAVAHEALSIIEPTAKLKPITLLGTIPDRLLMTTDEAKLRQALINLLGNAVKFTEEGEVRLDVRAEGDRVLFEVADTGIGISAEHLQRIFDRFWQVDQGSSRAHGGTGLGLTVTRRLAEVLGGSVEVRSEPGAGSTFILDLPVQAPAG